MPGDVYQLQQELQQARNDLAAKTAELASIEASFNDIKEQLAQVGDLIKTKDGEIEGLRTSNEQLLSETKNKDNSLVRSRAKIDLLEEASTKAKQEAAQYQQKCEEIENDKTTIEQEKATLEEKMAAVQQERDELQEKLDGTVKDMEGEIDTLRAEKLQISNKLTEQLDDVKSLENKVAELYEENAQLKNDLDIMMAKPTKTTVEKNQIITGRDNLIALFNQLLESAKHSVILVMPAIADLKDIDLTKLKPSVKALVSVKVDMTSQDDLDMVQELSKLSGVDLRSFNNDGRFGLNVDRGDVVIGVNSVEGLFGIYTQDRLAIDLFVKQFITDCWTGGRSLK